jgi:hypothetical protein
MQSPKESNKALVERLRAARETMEKVAIVGLARQPFAAGEAKEKCGNCGHFLASHEFCDMPDLQLPVDKDWWCLLWRG